MDAPAQSLVLLSIFHVWAAKKKKKAVKWQQAVVLHGIACLERARKLLIQRDREAQEAGGGGKPAPGQRL